MTAPKPVGARFDSPANELDFRLLGPVTVLRAGVSVPLGGPQRRALLAFLLSRRNRQVAVSDIIDALWPQDPPASAVGSVQVAISALRTALGDRDATGGALITTAAAGYQIAVDPEACDFHRFRRQVERGNEARAAGAPREAAATYRRALAEWSGRALQDLAGLRFADELSRAWEEDRLTCLESRIDADLTLGRHHEIVGELATLVHDLPLREGVWLQYLLALYRCARQAEALAAYRDLRRNLQTELGIEPGQKLRDLHSAILRQDPSLLGSHPLGRNSTLTALDIPLTQSGRLTTPHGEAIPIGQRVRLGRGSANQIVIEDPRASRQHAVVTASAAGFVVTDLTSTNGTRVNGAVIVGPTSLTDGDVISVGSYHLVFGLTPLA